MSFLQFFSLSYVKLRNLSVNLFSLPYELANLTFFAFRWFMARMHELEVSFVFLCFNLFSWRDESSEFFHPLGYQLKSFDALCGFPFVSFFSLFFFCPRVCSSWLELAHSWCLGGLAMSFWNNLTWVDFFFLVLLN